MIRDAAALAALHAASFTTPRPWSAAEIEALAADPAVLLLARPQGFAIGRTVLDEAELLTLAVAPPARRQGWGARLLAAFEAEARARGAARSLLEVAADNRPALALYAGAGYRLCGRRTGYYATPDGRRIDALVMERSLVPQIRADATG